ncbi:MAG: hypothetical protein QXG81_07265, partial [Ignisphaera sp.]
NGTGTVIAPDDVYAFGEAIDDITKFTEAIDSGNRGEFDRLRSGWAREVVKRNANINIRLNCVNWINRSFREDNLAKLLQSCYEKARQYAYFRAVTV